MRELGQETGAPIASLPSQQAVDDCFRPYIVRTDWDASADLVRRKTRNAYLYRRLLGWLPGRHRDQASVAWNYERSWAAQSLKAQLTVAGPCVPCEWREKKMMARAIATKRVHLLYLLRLLDDIRPTSVLEVGAGNGLNLLLMAACFPGLRLAGVELTAAGVEAARSTAEQRTLPRELLDFCPVPRRRDRVSNAVEFHQGDARHLPFADGEFDLVFTALALEQMEQIRDGALREIARVARKWVVMVEPFRDFNNSGIRRQYVRAHDYFSARIADLPNYRLHPLIATADMPHKLTLKPAFVVARKM